VEKDTRKAADTNIRNWGVNIPYVEASWNIIVSATVAIAGPIFKGAPIPQKRQVNGEVFGYYKEEAGQNT
jgi:hypothetical protein